MRCLVIIPMYGQSNYTKKCIEMVQLNAGCEHDILVVDDGSKEPFTSLMDPMYRVEVLRLRENTGFTNAVNKGILWAQKKGYDAVLLLNNDTEGEQDFLKLLVDNMESSQDIGINGSVRIHPKKKHERLALCGSDLIRGFQYFSKDDIPVAPFDCNIIPFASVLLRMDMIREIGLLDKRYKNHCSDTAYSVKAKMNGWRVVMVPESRVIHHLSVTTIANNVLVDDDQKIWIEELAGLRYAELMASMPLDGEAKTYGRLTFEVFKK